MTDDGDICQIYNRIWMKKRGKLYFELKSLTQSSARAESQWVSGETRMQLVHLRKICDQVHFIEQGKVLAHGTLEEILLHPSHPSIRKYLADTEVFYRGE